MTLIANIQASPKLAGSVRQPSVTPVSGEQILLRNSLVAQYTMNDNRPSPWVVGLNGVPTERVKNGTFEDESEWAWGPGWILQINLFAKWSSAGGYGSLDQNIGSASGEKWALFFEVKSGPGDIELQVKIGGTLFGTVTVKDRRYLFTGTAGDVNSLLEFAPISGTGVKIDNVFGICLNDFPLTGILYDATGDPRTNAHSVAGKVNTALSFDESDDHIIVYDEGALEFPANTQDFSIVLWFKPASLGVNDYLLDKRDPGGNGWMAQVFTDNKIYFKMNVSSWVISNTITNTNWHLIIVVVDRDGNAQIFVDNDAGGTPVDVSGESMVVNNPLFVGRTFVGGFQFQGDIDVTSFFNKALSEPERDWLWNSGDGREIPTRTRMLGNLSINPKIAGVMKRCQ